MELPEQILDLLENEEDTLKAVCTLLYQVQATARLAYEAAGDEELAGEDAYKFARIIDDLTQIIERLKP